MRLNRRDLLQGKLWKIFRTPQLKSLMMRYPQPNDQCNADEPSTVKPKSIHGIAIEPVAATQLTRPTPPRDFPVFRPPGAIEESRFLSDCTRCGDCITACPYQAIRQAPERLGAIAGTPIIDADTAACMMCTDFPCIAACDEKVLMHSLPKVIGTAKVTEHLCLAHHGTTCTVCSERCPVEKAIVVNQGKPVIDEEVCTGCGVCRYVCPAPENAILLMPIFRRPSGNIA